MVLAVVMIDRVGAGEPRCFDSKHDCSALAVLVTAGMNAIGRWP